MEGITLYEHFATLEDPRVERTKHHQRLSIITIALCAVICGADTWVDIEEFGYAKRAWLETFLDLANGIPSHDTDAAGLCPSGPGAGAPRVFCRGCRRSTRSCLRSLSPLMGKRPAVRVIVGRARPPSKW